MHFVGPMLPWLLTACDVLGLECPPRDLSVVINVSDDELDEALDDDDDLSLGDCKRLCPDNGVDKVTGCAVVEPDDAQISCDVEVVDDCH